MDGRIIDLHDLAADLHAIGHEHDVLEDLADDLGDRGLAVAGRSVDQHRVAGIDRGTETHQEPLRHDQALERLFHALARNRLVGDALAQDAILPGFERDRRGTEILAVLDRFLGPFAAGLGQGVAHFRNCAAAADRGAERLHQLAVLGVRQQLIDDADRQLQRFGELRWHLHALEEHALQHQLQQEHRIDTGFLEVERRRRHFADHRGDLLLRHYAQRDQAFADPAAVGLLVIERADDVVGRSKTLRHQNIPKTHYDPLLSLFLGSRLPQELARPICSAPRCMPQVSSGLIIAVACTPRSAVQLSGNSAQILVISHS